MNIDTNDPLTVATTLTLLVNRIVEAVAAPIRARQPNLDLWWLMYVSWGVSAVLIFASGINLLPMFPQYPVVGQVLTAIAIGGGAGLLSGGLDLVAALKQKLVSG